VRILGVAAQHLHAAADLLPKIRGFDAKTQRKAKGMREITSSTEETTTALPQDRIEIELAFR